VRRDPLSGALIGKGNYRHFLQKESSAAGGDRHTLHALINPVSRAIHLPELPFALGESAGSTLGLATAHHAGLMLNIAGADRPHPGRGDIASESATRARRCKGRCRALISQSARQHTLAACAIAAKPDRNHRDRQPAGSTIAREARLVLPSSPAPKIGVA